MMSLQLRGKHHSDVQPRPQPSQEQPSKESPRTLHQLLSLEQTSMNCIVTNLEKYPPDVLALLPLHFRRELLLLLPPADIFQLEQTKVVEGIDMDNEIWKVVCERFDFAVIHTDDLPLPGGINPLRHDAPQPISWTDHFLSCLVTFLFCMTPMQLSTYNAKTFAKHTGFRNYLVVLQLLFHKQFFKLTQFTDVDGFALQVHETVTLLPSRYSRFFTSSVPLSEWLRFLLEDCHMQPPKTIKLDLTQLNMVVCISFQTFFNEVRDVEFLIEISRHQPEKEAALRENVTWLCSVLSPCQNLKRARITRNFRLYNYGCMVIKDPIDDCQFNDVLQKCFVHPLFHLETIIDDKPPAILFQSLNHIDISGFHSQIKLSTLCSLFAFTCNHGFESISVDGPTIKSGEQEILQILEHSFTALISSSCHLVSLRYMKKVPFSFLLWLMKLFLSSPSPIAQKMVISGCEIDYTAIPANQELDSPPERPKLTDTHKCLHLSRLNLDKVFVHWIQLHFNSFVLDELCILHSPEPHRFDFTTTDVLFSLFTTLPNLPVCRIKSINVQFNMSDRWVSRCKSVYVPERNRTLIFLRRLFELAQRLPETAISLECVISSKHIDTLLEYLYDEWKNNSINNLLNRLLIQFSHDSLAAIPADFQSSLEKSLIVFPIHDIGRNVEIREKRV